MLLLLLSLQLLPQLGLESLVARPRRLEILELAPQIAQLSELVTRRLGAGGGAGGWGFGWGGQDMAGIVERERKGRGRVVGSSRGCVEGA